MRSRDETTGRQSDVSGTQMSGAIKASLGASDAGREALEKKMK
jgi:hypothetical protein